MKLVSNTIVALIEEDDASPKQREWALSHVVGGFVCVRTGVGEAYGPMIWFDPEDAIAFANAIILQANTIKEVE